MRAIVSAFIVLCGALVLSACVDAYEERGLCSYFGACEFGLGTELDNLNYCKELGSCDDGIDHTEYTVSGKPSGGGGAAAKKDATGSGTSGDSSSGDSGGAE